ncbi:MAG TPA: hydroxysqualene dehydroxylase HpnE [Acidobacteriaceae bacterium]|nr:hydroxysqualene dehydroxylase HpnE [Acidobacteriaceae bacterium]
MSNADRSVIVIGGGIAGIASACALADAGYTVRLLELRPYLGGRASSYEHPGTGEIIDNCQHVLIGRCTALLDVYRRLDVQSHIRWYDRFTFLTPGGKPTVLKPGPLPAPFHSSLSFLRAPAFSIADKLAIARGLSHFLRGLPPDSAEDFDHWLRRHGQTQRAIDRFWRPVLVSALNEDLDRISVHYAAKVFRESFLLSPESGRMGIPSIPLSELYNRAIEYIRQRGGEVCLRTSVDGMTPGEDGWTVTAADRRFSARSVILALSFETMANLLPLLPQNTASEDLAGKLNQFEHSPITGIHLWFDREVTDLDHAVLLDTTIQWMFNKSRLQPVHRGSAGSYLELVVSASKSLVSMARQEIIDLAIRELAMFFPIARSATLLKAAVVKEVRATYSIRPMLDSIRPSATSPWPQVFLAGDWTASGWPATMEGAARSGYVAAEAVARDFGNPHVFSVRELPASGLMRFV